MVMSMSASPSPHSIQSAIPPAFYYSPERRWKLPPQESLHTCRVCRKVLLSFRALNGHLRIHAGRCHASAQVHRNFPLPGLCWCRPHTIHTLPDMEEEVEVDQDEDYVIEADADADADADAEEDYIHDAEEPHHIQVTSCINNQLHCKRNPVYDLRQNPKRSRVMTDDDFWGLQDCPAKQLTSATPTFKAPACPCSMCAARSFCSLKALQGHMRSHPDLLPNSAHLEEPVHSESPRDPCAFSLLHLDTKTEDMKALCNGGDSPQRVELGVHSAIGVPARQQSSTPESALTSASLSIEEEPAQIHKNDTEMELGSQEASAAVCLVMLSKGITDFRLSSLCDLFNGRRHHSDHMSSYKKQEESVAIAVATRKEGKFQCKPWNRCFISSQPLGGHRPSHGKLKSSIARENAHANNVDSIDLLHEVKGHACSVCHRSFLTGRALGGHMRSHRTACGKYPDYEDVRALKFQQ